MTGAPRQLDKAAVADSFSRAAKTYDAAAVLQRTAGERLMERLDYVKLAPERILDLGCGTGFFTRQLAQRYPDARVSGIDLAPGMIEQARGLGSGEDYYCADAEQLPFPDGHFDLVFTNLTIQWIEDLDSLFRELQRVLKPGGLLLLTSLGPDTLKELRYSWAQADGFAHVNRFEDMHNVGDALLAAQFFDPVMDSEILTLTYRTVKGLMQDLKNIGAHNVNAERNHRLTGRTRLRKMSQAYETLRSDDGSLPATYELVYGLAWGREIGKAVGYHEYPLELKI